MSTSRYAGQAVVQPEPEEERLELSPRVTVDAPAVEAAGLTVDYEVIQGDRIDNLAFNHLGDSRLWWVIADLNPDIDPMRLVGGTTLKLPRT